MQYTITLTDGRKLMGLGRNGDNFVSAEKVDEDIFKDNLTVMTVSDGETETVYHNAELIQQQEWPDGWYLAFREKTAGEMAMESLNELGGLMFVTLAEGGQIDEVTAAEHTELFAPWAFPVSYTVGQIRRHGGKLYKCLTAHTSQEDWGPDVAPSLWVGISDPAEEWPAWSQPIGAHDAYPLGAKVNHCEKHWTSTVANNVWEPGVYGWEEGKS